MRQDQEGLGAERKAESKPLAGSWVYGTAGLAFGSLKAETFGFSETKTSAGWTIGAGAEFGLTQNWTAKVEYLYVVLSDSRFITTGSTHGYSSSLVRIGVNYKF